MEILDPKAANLAPETLNLFEEVAQTNEDLKQKRPFGAEVDARLRTEFLPDRITASLNMEGISISRRQTLLMMDAIALTESSSKDNTEIFNALKADELVYELAKDKSLLTASIVRTINECLQKKILKNAGKFRENDVEITGAAFQPPSPSEVAPLIHDLCSTYRLLETVPPILRAAWLHATFTRIHPFEDGNGRTGRLLQDFSLLTDGLYPTGIPSSRRDDYYDALEKADEGDWNPLCQMIGELELSILSRVKSILDEVQSRGNFISSLAKRATDKKTGRLHKNYIVWKQRMQNFADQVVVTCEELNSSSDVLCVRSEKFDVIDFKKWKEISETGQSSNTWFLKQTWFSEGEAFYRTIFFFRRHNYRPEDVHSKDDLYGVVSLQLTGGKPDFGARYDFGRFCDDEIKLRELIFVDDTWHAYTSTGDMRPSVFSGDEEVWDCNQVEDKSILIQGFLEDIFGRKLGI